MKYKSMTYEKWVSVGSFVGLMVGISLMRSLDGGGAIDGAVFGVLGAGLGIGTVWLVNLVIQKSRTNP